MAGLFIGSTSTSKVYIGTTEAQKVYVGTELVWPSVKAAGMTKSGVHTLGNTNRQTVAGWSVRSGYPDTVISTNRIQVVGSGTVTVFAQINFAGRGFSNVQDRWIVHNGVDMATAEGQSVGVTATFAVSDGDFIWFDAKASSITLNYDEIATTSYVTVTPV